MSSFVNLFKNLFSGVLSFIGGLFGSKKDQEAIAPAPAPRKARNSGYFLELDDAKGLGNAVAEASKTVAAQAAAKLDAAVPSLPAQTTKPKQSIKQSNAPEPAVSKAAAPKPVSANAALNLPQPKVTTFAPQYLAPNGRSNGRRRPGANMSSFLDMARQIKTAN